MYAREPTRGRNMANRFCHVGACLGIPCEISWSALQPFLRYFQIQHQPTQILTARPNAQNRLIHRRIRDVALRPPVFVRRRGFANGSSAENRNCFVEAWPRQRNKVCDKFLTPRPKPLRLGRIVDLHRSALLGASIQLCCKFMQRFAPLHVRICSICFGIHSRFAVRARVLSRAYAHVSIRADVEVTAQRFR